MLYIQNLHFTYTTACKNM